MSGLIDCRLCEELLSDWQDGSLAAPLRHDVDQHLAACPACRPLAAALAEVQEALAVYPVLDPHTSLADRIAAALPARRRAAAALRPPTRPQPLRLAAAASLIGLGLFLLVLTGQGGGRTMAHWREQAVHTGAYVAERKDWLVEDFRILGVVLGTAFEGRLDRVNDRVDDYRRLLERRKTAPERKKATSFHNPLNPHPAPLVTLAESHESTGRPGVARRA